MNHHAIHTKNPSTPSMCYRSSRLNHIATELFPRIKDRLLFDADQRRRILVQWKTSPRPSRILRIALVSIAAFYTSIWVTSMFQ
jgi:hypothetical protein